MNAIIQPLDAIFGKKLPQLPVSLKELIVKGAPWLVIIGLIVTAFSLLAIIPLVMGFATIAVYGAYGSMTGLFIGLIIAIIVGILELLAVPGLFKKTNAGWNFAFYAEIVSLIGMLISFNIVSLIISGLIGFYILFQIRPYYTGAALIGSAPTTPPLS